MKPVESQGGAQFAFGRTASRLSASSPARDATCSGATALLSMLRFARFRFRLLSLACFALAALGAARTRAQQTVPDYELPGIQYSKRTPNDAVARLQRRLDAGELVFQGTGRELLLAVLKALQVPVESQTLVFSKTSLQKERIGPATPRAVRDRSLRPA